MKKRIALITLLALCIAIVLAAMPMSIIAAGTTDDELVGTKLTTSHAGKTLSGDYYVEPDTTLTLRGGTGVSGLKVDSNKTLTIHIPEGSVLYVYGGNASGTTGAGAGIEVNSGSTLKIIGEGKLYTYGGKAANGSKGGNGENANWVDDGRSYIPDGGYGGSGGGGAGAGIGTKGGSGGGGAGWTRGFYGGLYQTTENFVDINYSGPNGGNGGSGSSANSCGAIYISADITYTATGGAAGTAGGSGGSRGSSDYESDNHWMRGMAGGAGGGGGGAGKAGANVGTGGGGGGGGGAGGGVGYAWSYRFLGGGGGGGGAGAVGGSGGAWAQDGEVPDCKKFQYFGGVERYSASGSSGGTSSGGSGAQGAKVKITDWDGDYWQYPYGGYGGNGGSAGSNCSSVSVQTIYYVTISVEDEIIGSYYASATEFLPETLTVPAKAGHAFNGFYAGDVEYYDENGVRTSAEITADTTISANFTANSYNFGIESSDGSVGGGANISGSVNYGDAITLTTPRRAGYLFRGWKISATSGSINQTAYYTYVSPTPMARMLRSSGQVSASFVYGDGAAMTAGFERIGDSITLYNLSADANAQLKIEEMWVEDSFTVTFKNFDGNIITTQNGQYGDDLTVPVLPNNQNDYYTYTFKYWKCNIDGIYYTSEELPFIGAFLDYESVVGNSVYHGVTFTAVYDITEYKKELHFVGSLGNDNLNDEGTLVLNSNDTNVDVVTNFKITKNDGVASLLLLPKYDANAFSIKAISVNGKLVYNNYQSVIPSVNSSLTSEVLNGFNVTVTGNETSSDTLKILLDNLNSDASTSEDIFIQIVYVMNTAIGGEYEFGFVTKSPTDTDSITHGDRSEAYGTYDSDESSAADAYKFNELKVTVDSTAIKVVIRATGEIVIDENQSFIYNGQQMSAAEVSEMIANVLQYTYNGFAKKEDGTIIIKWYDAEGNLLDGVPKNVGTYRIGISAAETTYYTAVSEVRATFTITPYEIYVTAGDQSFEYNGSNIVIDSSASAGGLFIKDAEGNLIGVDAFVNSEITLSGVELLNGYTNAGTYADVIQGIINFIGNESNYTVEYVYGDLTITKAENGWTVLPDDKTVEYSGNGASIDNVTADFGTVKVEYLVDYEKDANGNYALENGERVPIWSETPPTNAGTYPVRVTVQGNDNYSDLFYEVTLVITKKVISADGFTFDAIDKIYNGESQYWSLDPNGDNDYSDAEVQIIASNANSFVLQNVKFAGMLHPVDCTNAGTYMIQAVLTISNPNYTFMVDGEEIDSFTYDVPVEILKLNIVINANGQSAEYSGAEPEVSQGQGYLTITLEDGTAAPEFIIRDFFGGIREIYTIASKYDATATYYELIDGVYYEVTLTEEEFNANKALAGEEGYKEYYTKTTIDPETLILSKTAGVTAGVYDLIAALGESSNYTIVSCGGTFTITKKLIPVPELGILIYNGQTQCPEVPEGYEGIYEFVGGGKDVGLYFLTAVLLDKDNYAWENVLVTNKASLPTNQSFTVKIDGRYLNLSYWDLADYEAVNFVIYAANAYPYTTIDSTTDDIVLPWYIDQKVLTLVFPDATQSYEYGTFITDILNDLGDPTWKNGEGPYAGDSMTELHWLNYEYDNFAYPEVGTHSIHIVQGMFNSNYKVIAEGGKVEITKKILTQDDLKDQVSAVIKYYTGEELVLDVGNDFNISLFDYNRNMQQVFYVTGVNTNGHVNANGWINEGNFDYYIDEETGKIYVTVTVALSDDVKANYEFAEGASAFVFDVEAYIARAENSWTSGPQIDSSDITDIQHFATAIFGVYTVEFYTDSECQNPVVGEFQANATYYAKFTVEGNNNYYELETVIVFSGNHITIVKPIVRLDSETGEIVAAGQEITIVYDGQVHTLVIPMGNGYTAILDPIGECKNAGSYTVTVVLTDTNYAWEDGTQTELTYTLNIDKKALTITADDKEITFGGDAPTYTVQAEGFVNDETLSSLLGGVLADYINCDYDKGYNVNTYEIDLLDTIKNLLGNYEITLVDGTLTVNKLVFDYDDITSSDGNTLEDLINNGPSFIYDSESKEVKVEDLPEELEVLITYKDENGNVVSAPTNVGEYTVEITVQLKDGYEVGNYELPADAEISLTIEKARITITVDNQEYDYDGNDQSSKIPFGTYTIDVNNGQTLVDSIVLTIVNGEYINVGVYTDKISATHGYDLNNYIVTVENGDLIIKKVNNAWTEELNVNQNIVYDKNSVESGVDFFSDPKFGDGETVYFFYEKIGDTWFSISGAPSQAGEYAVVARVEGTDNYNSLISERVEFRILKATVTLDGITFENATVIYNGQAHSIYVTDNEALSLFSISYEGNVQVNAGRYPVIATFVLNDERNYNIDGSNTMTAELTIESVRVIVSANNNESMYGNAINNLTYTVVFDGAAGYDNFYTEDFGSIALSTNATYMSNVGQYPISIRYTANDNYIVETADGIYSIVQFVGNEIYLNAENVNYLMDLVYSATALRGQGTVEFAFATSSDGPFNVIPKNVGTYYVKAIIAETENYEGAEAIVSFEITRATLSAITGITYNADTATWSAVVTTTDGKQIDCDVTYLVDGNTLTAPSFKANEAGSFTVTALPSDTANYHNSEAISLLTVYTVSFADKFENHDRQETLADLGAPAFATQYRFEGQSVTRPESIPTVVGYTFREWQLDDVDYTFAVGVTDNITLYADWTINTYILCFYNEVVTGSSVVNGVFVEGAISYEFLTSYTVTYGSPFNLTGVNVPTKLGDAVYTYQFAYWSDARGNDLDSTIYVYDNMDIYAVYNSIAREFTVTYMVSIDGGAYAQYNVVTLPYGATLETLGNVAWFVGDTWYTDANRQISAPDFVPAANMTLYGAYVFDIGAGDVNADGNVNTDDIVDYRRWIVGGYNIVTVEAGTEWALVNSHAYDSSTVYYLVRVSDANCDDSGDIRDITTIRMALTGGYGYVIETNNEVTGDAITLVIDRIPGISDADALREAFNEGTGDVYIKLTSDITLDQALVLDSGRNVTIHLNGYTLTLPSTDNYGVVVKNGILTIEGQGNVIVPGELGFGTSSTTTNGHIVINGGTYVGENAYYLFGCYNGSITISGGDFTGLYCVLNNFSDDGNGNTMSGVATVNGGSFEVTDTDTYYRPFIFLGEVDVAGAADYRVRTAENLAIALKNGGTVTLVGNVIIDEDALGVYIPYYLSIDSIIVPVGKSVVLDLNGYTISHEAECTESYVMINNKGSLTINDSVGTGKISFNDTGAGDPDVKWASYTIRNQGTLVVNGGTIEHLGQQPYNGNNAIFNYSGSTTINGGTILAQYSRTVRLWHGSLTINGGDFDGQVWVQAMSDCALTISGGSFKPATYGNDASSVYITNDTKTVEVSVSGGTFKTKIGCSNPDQLAGAVVGGVFTETAKDNTNSTLINDSYEFIVGNDGTYTLAERELQ